MRTSGEGARGAIAFRDRRAFWAGVTAITVGVALHLPMYLGASEMGYRLHVVTSTLASELEPQFGWRIMWLIGLPTGLALIALNRWIPESPRFLLSAGRVAEARAVMERFGARVVTDTAPERPDPREPSRYAALLRRPFTGLTAGVVLFGLGWGLVNNGFLLWLPTTCAPAAWTWALPTACSPTPP